MERSRLDIQTVNSAVLYRVAAAVLLAAVFPVLTACSGEPKDTSPVVPVQIVSVEKAAVEQKVTADAVLFPVAQSAIVPKISAPVKKFLVNRGSHVRAGQLLAVLENRDLAAAAQENKGAYTQAEAAYETTTSADLPQELQKARLDAQAAKQQLDTQQKVFDSRQDLFQQGALPRKELDQAGVDLTNARNQYEIAQKHLDSLNAIGKQQTLKSAKGQLESAQGKYEGASAQLSYSEIRSPIDGVVTERPLYPGEMAGAGTPLLTVMDISQGRRQSHDRSAGDGEADCRQSSGCQSRTRSEQHNRPSLGASQESRRTSETGNKRPSLHDRALCARRVNCARGSAAECAGWDNFGDGRRNVCEEHQRQRSVRPSEGCEDRNPRCRSRADCRGTSSRRQDRRVRRIRPA